MREKIGSFRLFLNQHHFAQNKVMLLSLIFVLALIPLSVLATLTFTTFLPKAATPVTPPVPCKQGVNTFSVGDPCQTTGFKSASYACYDGATGQFRTVSCRSSDEFNAVAQEACNRLSNPVCLPSPTPSSQNRINWRTSYVSLEADDFYIIVDGKKFLANTANLYLNSDHPDPLNPNYTTLEAKWQESGVEMRLYIYFYSNNVTWWSDEIRTYDGQVEGKWIYYKGRFFETEIGRVYTHSGTLDLSSTSAERPFQGRIHFENLRLQAFTNRGTTPTPIIITPTPTPVLLTPTPTTAPLPTPTPLVNHTPEILTQNLPQGRIFQYYQTKVSAEDQDKDDLKMSISGLPRLLRVGSCTQASGEITCPISGRLWQRGVFNVEVAVTDSQGSITTKILPLIIR